MQEEVHIHPDLAAPAEELQELRVVELRLQQVVQRHAGARAGDGDRPVAALELEDADLVARDGEVDVRPLPLRVALPRGQDAAVRQLLGRVLEGAEAGHAAGALQLSLVVPLLGEGHEEALLALFVLQRHHGLLDVVVVRLELLLQVRGLVVEAREREADPFELALPLDAPPVLGADVDGDFVEEVLVVIVAGEVAYLLEAENIFESGAFEFGVGKGGHVDDGGGFGVGATAAGGGGEFVIDERRPAIFVFHCDGFDHDFHEIGAGLDTDDVEDAAFRFHEERLGFGIGIWMLWLGEDRGYGQDERLTFLVMQLWIQGKTDLGAADMLEFMLVVLDAAQLPDHFTQHIILTRAYARHITSHKVMDGEDVRHFDVQCWLGASIQVVKLVDVELSLGRGNIDYWHHCQ